MISSSDKVLKLLGRFSLAWKFSGTNSCISFYSNLKQKKKKKDHHFKFLPFKSKSYFFQLSDLWKTRRCGYTSSQTGQPFSTQNTYRGYITGVRNFQSKLFGGVDEKTVKLHIWKHEKLLLCLSFAKLFLLFVHEAKNVFLILFKYSIRTENTPHI